MAITVCDHQWSAMSKFHHKMVQTGGTRTSRDGPSFDNCDNYCVTLCAAFDVRPVNTGKVVDGLYKVADRANQQVMIQRIISNKYLLQSLKSRMAGDKGSTGPRWPLLFLLCSQSNTKMLTETAVVCSMLVTLFLAPTRVQFNYTMVLIGAVWCWLMFHSRERTYIGAHLLGVLMSFLWSCFDLVMFVLFRELLLNKFWSGSSSWSACHRGFQVKVKTQK